MSGKAVVHSLLHTMQYDGWDALPQWFRDAYELGEFVICPASIYVRKLEARFNDWILVDDAGEVSVQPRPSESSHDYPACAMFRGGKCTCDQEDSMIETKTYPDGTRATGPAPLPNVSPAQGPLGQKCQICNGAGNVDGEPCKPCDRTGRVQEWPINKQRRRKGLPPITQCEAPQTEEQRTIATLNAFKVTLEAIGRHYCYDCAARVNEPCGAACMLDENPPMPQSTAERQKAFKDAQREAGMVRLEAWVTKEQREKFRALGGDAWLRKRIDAAKQQVTK